MKAIDYILTQLWAMQPEHVAQIIAVAERTTLDPEAVAAKLGRPLDNTRKVEVREGVAVIPVRGVIARYANLFTEICDGTSVDVLARDFRTALDSPSVHSIILEIDSPGGQAAGIGELAGMIREGSKSKSVVCYVSHLGASAGYWLASAGSEVVAAPSAILGSVGVVLPVAKNGDGGRTIEFVSSQSPNKRPNPNTEAGRANIQATVDAMAEVFIADVAAFRGVKPEKVVSDFGAGGVLVGQAAVDAGMADRLGSLESLIRELNGGRAGKRSMSQPGAAAGVNVKGSPTMKFRFADLVAAWFSTGRPEVIDVPEGHATADDAPTAEAIRAAAAVAAPIRLHETGPTARERALEVQLSEAKAALDAAGKAKAADLTASAETWFAAQVKAERVTPAEKDGMVAAFVDFATADAREPISFLAKDGGRVGIFKAGIEGRKPGNRTVETVPTDAAAVAAQLAAGGLKVFPSAASEPDADGAKAAESRKRVNAMLAATEAGASLPVETAGK